MITRIAVMRDKVVRNEQTGEEENVIIVQREGELPRQGIGATMLGPSTLKYDPAGCPVLGGVRVWIETTGDVVVAQAHQDGSGVWENCGRC